MKQISRKDLDAPLREALEKVETALERSHCPHSGLSVAAGLLMAGGETVVGVNYESASYGLTLCAERAAIARAQAEGTILQSRALILATFKPKMAVTLEPLTPCGACRQWLSELSVRLQQDLPVYSFWKDDPSGLAVSTRALLPDAFQSFS